MTTQHTTDIKGNLVYKPLKLSGSDSRDIKKVTQLMLDVIKTNRRLWRKEISDWQRGRQLRYSKDNPQNHLLQEVYDDVMLDGQLTGITENRTFRSTNKDYIFVDKQGKKDDKCTEYIKDKTWFENFLKITHETVYYGTGVIWLKEFNANEILTTEQI